MTDRGNGWSEYGGYMNAKIQKLENQTTVKKQISEIFYNICIFINGFTEPSDHELKEIIQSNGGKYCHYYKKDTVTHIIANNLPASKINKLTNEKIVMPKWITDSVEAGKLLEWSKYELYSERHKSNQNMMKAFVNKPGTTGDNGKEIDTGALSLSEFYAKSRLHHLSTWATELKNYLQILKNDACENGNDPRTIFPGREEFIDHYNKMIDQSTITTTEPLVMHIDMDCFFVSVGIRNKPELIDRPVVVTHSNKGLSAPGASPAGSMSEIASCSYEARKFGIKNGMHLGKAKKLCPDLVTIPYDFEGYLEVAKTLYKTASGFTHDIEVGSCDELYINLIDVLKIHTSPANDNEFTIIDPVLFAQYFRSIIKTDTQCSASCGIGSNLLICKLATKLAKPDGQFWLKTCDVIDRIKEMSVRDLPGIGRVLEDKLKKNGIENCADLQKLSLEKLRSDYGIKFGQRLFDMCRGKDNRTIQPDRQRKSVSAEINYGIRLQSMDDCEKLLGKLSEELSKRLIQANVVGQMLVLKIMVRHPDASIESVKYLGHGFCNNLSKSVKLPNKTNGKDIIYKQAIQMFRQLEQDVKELRGVGLTMQKLNLDDNTNCKRHESNKILNFFQPKIHLKEPLIDKDYLDRDDDDCTIVENLSSEDDDKDALLTIRANVRNLTKLPILRTGKSPESCAKTVSFADNVTVTTIKSRKKTRNRVLKQNKLSEYFHKEDTFIDLSKSEKGSPSDDIQNCIPYEVTDDDVIDYLAILGKSSLDVLKEEISFWIQAEPVPTSEDSILIRNQISKMVCEGIHVVHDMVMVIKNTIEEVHDGTENETAWNHCFAEILDVVQDACYNEFGAYLEIE